MGDPAKNDALVTRVTDDFREWFATTARPSDANRDQFDRWIADLLSVARRDISPASTEESDMVSYVEGDVLTKDDLRVLRRLTEAKRSELRRKPETTADVAWAYDNLADKLRRAVDAEHVVPTLTTQQVTRVGYPTFL